MTSPSQTEKNRRVLVIDDMRSIHDDFKKILGGGPAGQETLDAFEATLFADADPAARATFTLDSAFQGQEGFEKVKRAVATGERYAMAFVDVRMPPGWDGVQTIEHLWSVDPDLQVVICTAYSDYSWSDMIARLGHSDRMVILRKPFDNIEVLQLATALTEKWHLLQQSRRKVTSLESDVATRTRELERANVELKRSLAERERTQAALKKSEELFRTLSVCSPIGIWLVDAEGACRYANEHWTTLSGLTTEQTLGHGWARAVHPEDLAVVAQAWTAPATERMAREFRLRRPDQSVRWVLLQSADVRDESGTVTGRVATIEDISNRKETELALGAALAEAEAASHAKCRALVGMNRKIRTPLNDIARMSSLLLDTAQTAEQRERTEHIRESADTLQAILVTILDFAEIESRQLVLEHHDFNLRETMERALDLLAPQAQGKGLELAGVELAPNVPTRLRGDSGRLRQVVDNLLKNAIAATERGEVALRIVLERDDGSHAVIKFAVRDTGCGIAPEERAQLFQPFIPAGRPAARESGGTGLGLAIAKELVALMQGQMGVTSEVGRGSTFWFTARWEKQPPKAPPPPFADHWAGTRVLVIDDNATQRGILGQHLAAWRMEATPATSGAEALELLRAAAAAGAPFAVGLIDFELPGMNGLALARAIKAEPALAATRLILLSHVGLALSVAELDEVGVDAHLAKPVKQSRLADALGGILARDADQGLPAGDA